MPTVAARRPAPARAHVGGDVDVRVVGLCGTAEELARAESLLSGEELRRARRGIPAVHRSRVFLRAALREALAEHLGIAPAGVPIAATAAGRPVVRGCAVDVSCSASDGLGIVVVSDGRRVGVDIERVRPWTSDVLEERWLAGTERWALLALPPAERGEAATRAWTRKEAVLKARGTGLLEAPRAVVTPVGRPAGVVAGWAVHDLPVPPGWVASLAVAATEEDLA